MIKFKKRLTVQITFEVEILALNNTHAKKIANTVGVADDSFITSYPESVTLVKKHPPKNIVVSKGSMEILATKKRKPKYPKTIDDNLQ
ncbi:MAG: hypothetical protein MUE53_05325 [Chitinophagales bacterium]|jgi:hypothetical protein|nr:hypothetical protein [Chitinophagales bacterium]